MSYSSLKRSDPTARQRAEPQALCPYCITGHTTLAHRAGATDEQVAAAWETMRDTNIIVAGKLKRVTGPGGSANTLIGSQFFVRYESKSAEGQVCGGRTGPCPDGYVCQFRSEICDHADGTGVCERKPEVCAEIYEPVCGCDGVTYANDCSRRQMGAGFGTPGECRVARGCQIGGCGGELCRHAS